MFSLMVDQVFIIGGGMEGWGYLHVSPKWAIGEN